MKFQTIHVFLITILFCSFLLGQEKPPNRDQLPVPKIRKPVIDDYWHYHDVGNVGLTVTNYGILGQGYQSALQDQPSCQYKFKSRLDVLLQMELDFPR